MLDKKWFIKHQRLLLWLINAPLISVWFRRVLRISYYKQRITEILPNSVSWGDRLTYENGKFYFHRITDFRTHEKFRKRIYYAFRWIWILFHYWDILIANKINPAWNLGFDNTFYPDAHPETTSVDGEVARSGVNESWTSIRTGAGTSANDSAVTHNIVDIQASGTVNQWQLLRRGIFLFDTSSLSDSATVTAATFSIFGTAKSDGCSITPNINVYTSTPASNTALVAADYGQIGSTAQADTAITFVGYNISTYNDFTLNATGRAAVSLTGVTKFGVRNANYDVAGVDPTWSNSCQSYFGCHSADQTGTTNDPKLVVAYTITISPPAGTISLTGNAPTFTIKIDVPAGTITISAPVPTITKTGGWDFQTKNTGTWTFTPKS